MRALLQRVSGASVTVDGETVGSIGNGLLVFLAVGREDSPREAQRLVSKVLQLRIFPDSEGKMNINIAEANGSLLVVSQFTLYGETDKGNRPSYSAAASPEQALPLYELFVNLCRGWGLTVETGKFKAHMQVHLVNDGPVTLFCEAES